MRYAVISDLHANLQALQAVLSSIDSKSVDQIVCLGDVVGYNANPNECITLIQERNVPTVCGNHDAVACGIEDPLGFNPVAYSAAMWTREALQPRNTAWLTTLPVNLCLEHMLAAHGTPNDHNPYMFRWEDTRPYYAYVEECGVSLCFFGHTHCPGIFSSDGTYMADDDGCFKILEGKTFFINPGSVGQPRDGDCRAAYGLMDTDSLTYQLIRVPYPVKEAADRVVAAGLDDFLAERLFVGR